MASATQLVRTRVVGAATGVRCTACGCVPVCVPVPKTAPPVKIKLPRRPHAGPMPVHATHLCRAERSCSLPC